MRSSLFTIALATAAVACSQPYGADLAPIDDDGMGRRRRADGGSGSSSGSAPVDAGGSESSDASSGSSEPPEVVVPPVGSGSSVGDATSRGAPCGKGGVLTCPNGAFDGCTKALTTHHVCVQAGTTSGPSCALQVAVVCDSGFEDACSQTPAPASKHVCVEET